MKTPYTREQIEALLAGMDDAGVSGASALREYIAALSPPTPEDVARLGMMGPVAAVVRGAPVHSDSDAQDVEDAIIGHHQRDSNERGKALAALARLRDGAARARAQALEAEVARLKANVIDAQKYASEAVHERDAALRREETVNDHLRMMGPYVSMETLADDVARLQRERDAARQEVETLRTNVAELDGKWRAVMWQALGRDPSKEVGSMLIISREIQTLRERVATLERELVGVTHERDANRERLQEARRDLATQADVAREQRARAEAAERRVAELEGVLTAAGVDADVTLREDDEESQPRTDVVSRVRWLVEDRERVKRQRAELLAGSTEAVTCDCRRPARYGTVPRGDCGACDGSGYLRHRAGYYPAKLAIHPAPAGLLEAVEKLRPMVLFEVLRPDSEWRSAATAVLAAYDAAKGGESGLNPDALACPACASGPCLFCQGARIVSRAHAITTAEKARKWDAAAGRHSRPTFSADVWATLKGRGSWEHAHPDARALAEEYFEAAAAHLLNTTSVTPPSGPGGGERKGAMCLCITAPTRHDSACHLFRPSAPLTPEATADHLGTPPTQRTRRPEPTPTTNPVVEDSND